METEETVEAKAKRLAVKILARAEELIAGGWIQNRLAADASNLDVSEFSDNACQFCFVGALSRAHREVTSTPESLEAISRAEQALRWLRTLNRVIYGTCEAEAQKFLGSDHKVSLVGFNDNSKRTKEDVLAVLAAAKASVAADELAVAPVL